MKLQKKIKCIKDGKEFETDEIEIKKEDFTPKILLEAEREFLMTGGVFPQGDIESSRAFLAIVAFKMIGCSYDTMIEEMTGLEFLEVTNAVKGLYDGLGWGAALLKALEKQS